MHEEDGPCPTTGDLKRFDLQLKPSSDLRPKETSNPPLPSFCKVNELKTVSERQVFVIELLQLRRFELVRSSTTGEMVGAVNMVL